MKKYIVGAVLLTCLSMSLLQAQQKPKVAILPFAGSGISASTLELLTQFLGQELNASGAFVLADLNTVKSTLSSAGYAEVNCFDLACARNMGQTLGVEKVVLSRITKAGNQVRLETKTVDVAVARETFSETVEVPSEDGLFTKLADLTGRLVEALKQPVTAGPSIPQAKTVTPPPAPSPSTRPQLQILHQPIKQATLGQGIRVIAQVQPALGENELFLIYRAIGDDRFRFTPMKRVVNEEFSGEIPAEAVSAKGVEYYLRAIDRSSNELGRFPAGNTYLNVTVGAKVAAAAPPPVTPPKEKEKKSGGKKWLWIGVGATAVGAGAYLASQKNDGENSTTVSKLPPPPNHP